MLTSFFRYSTKLENTSRLYSYSMKYHNKCRDHEQQKYNLCERCGEKFKYDVTLRYHKDKHKTEDEGFISNMIKKNDSMTSNVSIDETQIS